MADGRKRPGPLEGLMLESDETAIIPSQISRHEAQKHEEDCRWCPRRARHVLDTRGCCCRIARIYLVWVLSSAVFRDVRSFMLAVWTMLVWVVSVLLYGSAFKTHEKNGNNPRSILNTDTFSWKSWQKKREINVGNSHF